MRRLHFYRDYISAAIWAHESAATRTVPQMYFTNFVIVTLVRRFFFSPRNHHQAIGRGSRGETSGQSQQTTGSHVTNRDMKSTTKMEGAC